MPSIDAFTRRRLPEVSQRFLKLRNAHERAVALMWRGALASLDDGEINVLRHSGFLSQADEDHLRAIGRGSR